MTLQQELERAAAAASVHGPVAAVLAAEPGSGGRGYLVALGGDDSRAWLVLDADLAPVSARERIREIASIVVLCELAGELAGGGDLEELRAQLAQLRLTEQPRGIDEAEDAALELEHAIGAAAAESPRPPTSTPWRRPPAGSSSALGGTRRAVRAGDRGGAGTVEAFVAEVESAAARRPRPTSIVKRMEGGGFGFPFGGDPEDLLRGLREFAEQQAETVQEAQREQFATLTLNTAVELTVGRARAGAGRRHGRRAGDRPPRRDARALPRGGRARLAARQGFMRERG